MSDATTPVPPPGRARPPAVGGRAPGRAAAPVADLTRSVERLASGVVRARAPPLMPSPTRSTPTRDPAPGEFAYLFLGEVLARRGAPVLGVRGLRSPAKQWPDLHAVARWQRRPDPCGERRHRPGGGPGGGNPAPITIPDEQPIDSIVVLESRDGVAVALGPCLDRVPNVQ